MLFMNRQSSHIKHLRQAVVTLINFRLQRGSQHRGKSSLNSFQSGRPSVTPLTSRSVDGSGAGGVWGTHADGLVGMWSWEGQ